LMCVHLFNPPEPSCQDTDGQTPYNIFARACGNCPCVPPLRKLSFPSYIGVNSGQPYPAQTLYLRRIPQYIGNAVSGGNDLCNWRSTEGPNDTSPITVHRSILGYGFRYSQSVLGGSTQLGWGILYYDSLRFLPFVGVTSW